MRLREGVLGLSVIFSVGNMICESPLQFICLRCVYFLGVEDLATFHEWILHALIYSY